ncbi:zinc finger protein 454-like [Schistocerca gregaria]|uniref:zinc finger protein 454-like n=1 Tax=Schistocerca gregaria TaxID=7010 RepID=UPI00211DE8E6|nr:zinc finger protein 454-like [Schistocerca gregaria]
MAPEQHATSVCDGLTIKQEPVEAEPHMTPKREIEYVSVKEAAPWLHEWEEPDDLDSAQDPLSIAKLELKHGVESTTSGSELASNNLVGVEDDNGTGDSGSFVGKVSMASGTSGGIQTTSKQEASCGNKNGTRHRVYSCGICKMMFARLQDLKSHTHIIHEFLHTCNVCLKTFARSSTVKSHMRLHNKERPYNCGVCKRTFVAFTQLKMHSQQHTDEYPYTCGICSKTFTQSSSLKYHLMLHPCTLPFSCEICKKTFQTNSHLKKHYLLHTDYHL